ncbi:hypothetical protein GCM10010310_32870 [Streptomyces violaceolatus]|uniref:Uncharacterized protein n=1 Tax=Streptomyces violaceolatus TaxID=67378 RepID=A0ABN3SQB9_9ACTN
MRRPSPAWLAAPASAGAQGGDFGAGISAALGAVAPEHVVGVHVTCLPTRPVPDAGIELSETDSARLDKTRQLMANRPPYQALQARRPHRHWSEFERGGHLAAMEVPELLAEDVRDFSSLAPSTTSGEGPTAVTVSFPRRGGSGSGRARPEARARMPV